MLSGVCGGSKISFAYLRKNYYIHGPSVMGICLKSIITNFPRDQSKDTLIYSIYLCHSCHSASAMQRQLTDIPTNQPNNIPENRLTQLYHVQRKVTWKVLRLFFTIISCIKWKKNAHDSKEKCHIFLELAQIRKGIEAKTVSIKNFKIGLLTV